MAKKASIIVCILLLAYFIFTSGLVFEVTASDTMDRVDMPYSIAMSGERTGAIGIYNEDDIACAEWLAGDDAKGTAAILFMDVWAEIPSEYWVGGPEEKVWTEWWNNEVIPYTATNILSFLDWARQSDMMVIFTAGADRELVTELEIEKHGEPIINDGYELDGYLMERGITTIFYTGYATNLCVLTRSTGMRAMDSLGYNVVLVGDCSLPVPAYSCTYEQALDEIRTRYGGVITMAELGEVGGEGILPIHADYNGISLVLDYSGEFGRFTHSKPVGGHYLFLTSWNVEHQKMVAGISPALRGYEPLPELNGAVTVYRKGDAIVYYINRD